MALDQSKIESEILALGTEIFHDVQNESLSVFDPQFYSGKLMDWAMKDEEFKISLFRFVDVLPSLATSADVIRHAQEYFQPVQHRIPGLLKWGLNLNPESVRAKIAAQVIRKQIRSMAEQFILGETPKLALKSLRKIRREGLAFTVDLLGEAVVSEEEAEIFINRYSELLDTMAMEVPQWPESAELVPNHPGEKSPLNISIKPSALYSQAKAIAADKSIAVLVERLTPLVRKAKEVGSFVYLDMEDTSFTSITIEAFQSLLSQPEFKDFADCGIVLQAYLRRTKSDVENLQQWGRERGTPFGVRLVKGAYWDTETILAKQRDWPIPVWQEKSGSDKCYEEISLYLLEHPDVFTPAFGSHNIRSLCHAVKAAELLGREPTSFEIQALYGMAEPIKKAFASRGFLVRDYAPIGELLPGMGYLVRRLLENTSNEGFLRQSFRENESPELLLRTPDTIGEDNGVQHINQNYREEFSNVPLTDFSLKAERAKLTGTLEEIRLKLKDKPEYVAPIIDGNLRRGTESLFSVSPEDRELKLAEVSLADEELAAEALAQLNQFFPFWRNTSVDSRAEILHRAAEILEERRAELSATIVLEAGKQWVEADADVAEAIDFLNYYAHQAKGLLQTRRVGEKNAGEVNLLMYEPRGTTLVISPWNFPLAIPCGMFSAALVTGNCVVLKPAEQTSLIASKFFQIMLDAGMPAEAAAFLPGRGETIGHMLVRAPEISTIVFTGSKAVGLDIIRAGAEVATNQEHVKRVIAEMGGKNAMIIDSGADLDEAVKGVTYSAFGFQGQKCSACSRVYVLESIYENFIGRLKSAVESIDVAPSSKPESYVGPVIDEESQLRILSLVEHYKKDCTLLAEGKDPANSAPDGFYVRPTVFTDIPLGHEILSNEIFGPVLAVVKVSNFEEALELALQSEYGLTGGLFSRSPKNIALAMEKFRVGNLYLNRGCTGAMVCRQPFGGAKMSGVGSKAGGPDYLHQFILPRAISENTMRRGFAPM